VPTSRGCILLVDDNVQILETTARYLMARGFEVLTTDSALGVSSLVRHHRPAIIVLDVMMPALNGDKLVRVLTAQRTQHVAPIILYSAMDEEQLYAMVREIPGGSYVVKSQGLKALYAEIVARLESVGSSPERGDRG
jgi:two-component system phosphate regulon response regulator OmpR